MLFVAGASSYPEEPGAARRTRSSGRRCPRRREDRPRLGEDPLAEGTRTTPSSGRSHRLPAEVPGSNGLHSSECLRRRCAARPRVLPKTLLEPARPLLQLHHHIDALVIEQSPHTKAYNAGVAGLYRAEKQAAADQSLPLSDEQALRIARLQVCMAPRVAESSFSLRALWYVGVCELRAS